MHGKHASADNLFVRLASYTPRKDRQPLEDFCSEALVWCLRNSTPFRQRFFALTKLPCLFGYTEPLLIHSQQGYEEAEEESGAPANVGRFDIVVESEDASFFVAIESKVGASFGKDQLAKYLKRLQSIKKQNRYANCHLVTLTNIREPHDPSVTHLYWGDVHEASTSGSKTINDKALATDPPEVRALVEQFAEFLAYKKLAKMKIEKTTPLLLNEMVRGMSLRTSLEGILASLKTTQHLKTLLARKHPKFESDEGDSYVGYYGRTKPTFFYIGFRVCDATKKFAGLKMYIQCSVVGEERVLSKALPAELKKIRSGTEHKAGQTWYSFEQTVDGEYDGNAEAMRGWFNTNTAAVLKFGRSKNRRQ